MLRKSEKTEIYTHHKKLKSQLESEYENSTKMEFRNKLGEFFSKLDDMLEAALVEEPSFLEKLLKFPQSIENTIMKWIELFKKKSG